MDIAIREATEQDAYVIAQLNRECMGYDYPKEETAVNLTSVLASSNDKVFVATVDGSVVGYIHANDYQLLYAPPMKNIMGIAVSPTYRRCGIGKKLMDAVEQWAAETGAAAIRLVSGAVRKEAHAFYKCCGFTDSKEQINLKKML